MPKKKKTRPKGIMCVCLHAGGAKGTRHAGGVHGIHAGFGKCLAKGCTCRRFMPRPGTFDDGEL